MHAGFDPAAAGVTARAAERSPVDRRAQILDAARAVLSRQGYAETSMKDIAAEAGVAPGLLHYYFESKEEILLQVVGQVVTEMLDSHREAVRVAGDPLDAVANAMDKAAERCSDPGFCRLLLDAYSLALSSDVIREQLRPIQEEMIRSTRETADEVMAHLGFDHPGAPKSEDLAIALVGAIDGIAMQTALRGGESGGAYQALKSMVLAHVAMGYLMAGQQPPLDRLLQLVYR